MFTPSIITQKQINIRILKLSCISAPKIWSHIKNTVVLTILTFRYIQRLHLVYAEIAWALVSSGTQVQPQLILDPDYLPEYLSVSYGYGYIYIVCTVLLRESWERKWRELVGKPNNGDKPLSFLFFLFVDIRYFTKLSSL